MKAFAVLALVLALAAGCTTRIYSPPSRVSLLESSRALDAGETTVRAGGGGASYDFGAALAHGSVKVRHGVGDGLELHAEGMAAFLLAESATNPHPGIYGLRVGVKHQPVPDVPHFALFGGIGGGGSAGGGFIAPDLGFIVAWENPYFVPFLSGFLGMSVPIAPKSVDLSKPDEGPGAQVIEPQLTFLYGASLGARIPILGEADTPDLQLLIGLDFTGLHSSYSGNDITREGESQGNAFLGASGAIEYLF
ncbi:MAG: hypothetical protein KC416_02495 [Myxococcales bacterium]|nr:hypothetical protein [Myxococcales bacterium]